MTKEEALQFKERWKRVNQATIEEARNTSVEERLRQLDLLYQAVQSFGWGERMRIGEEEVRARWVRLKIRHDREQQ